MKAISGHSEWVRQVLPSRDGLLLASCSNDKTVKIWNFDVSLGASKDPRATLYHHEHVVECLAWAPSATNAILLINDDATNNQNATQK